MESRGRGGGTGGGAGVLIGLVLLALLPGAAAGAVRPADGALLVRARHLLALGNAKGAADLLQAQLLRFAGTPDFDYLLGEALYAAGRSSQAVFAFERVLIVEPANQNARLKLARLYAESGEAALARTQLAHAESRPLSRVQEREVEAVRRLIAQNVESATTAWTGYLMGGVGWDTNVTSGPESQFLLLPGVDPFRPTDIGPATRQGDALRLLEAGGTLRTALGGQSWLVAGGSIHEDSYRVRRDERDGYTNLYVGLAQQRGQSLVSVMALGQNYRVGGKTYRNMLAGRINWVHRISQRTRITGYDQYSAFTYPDYRGDDADRNVIGLAGRFSNPGGWSLQWGFDGGGERTRNPATRFLGYRLWGAQAGGVRQLTDRLSFSAGAVFETRRYTAPDRVYRIVRRDRQWGVGLTLDCRLARRLHLIPQITYIRNISNMALYDYRRAIYTLNLRWDFGNETI